MRHIVPKMSNQANFGMKISQKDKDEMEKTLKAQAEMASLIKQMKKRNTKANIENYNKEME